MNTNQIQLTFKTNKGKVKYLRLRSGQAYVVSKEANADIKLDHNSDEKATIYEENGKWVLMCIHGKIQVNEQWCASTILNESQKVILAELMIQIIAPKGKRECEDKKLVNSTRLLLILLLLLLVFFVLNNRYGSDIKTDTDTQKLISTKRTEVTKIENDTEVSEFGQVENFYRQAVNFYELGKIKDAMDVLQKGLHFAPENKILQEKLLDWSVKMDVEITRYYQQGCIHAKYLRQHEALQTFMIVKELSFNTVDARYQDSKRIVDSLEEDILNRVTCGDIRSE